MFKIENFGLSNQTPTYSKDDQKALHIMNSTIKKIENRYEIEHLYRFENMKFPNNKSTALKILELVEKIIDRIAEYAEKYCAKIEDYLQKGYAKKLSKVEAVEDAIKSI